ncbi:major facilitator superfamily domain-containing protein [Aspergillus undulatus]|uniref:major facilitator superfamily domain-containing protein n=1 Tax=Aspergillus undulatus TaxID=1810928 RepID=UPI003CCD2016
MATEDKHIASPGCSDTKDNTLMEDIAEVGHAATDHLGRSLLHTDREREAKLRKKIDWYMTPLVSLIHLFCFIDRSNIGNARLGGLEIDLNMTGNDFNVALSIFYISYILFEVPAIMLCKRIGPGWFLPATCLGFGVASLGTAFVTSYAQLCGVRFVLGIFEAGMLPGISYYLSRWYRRAELTWRMSFFIVSAALAGAFGGLLASAILSTPDIGSVTSWKKIFLVEGIITCGIALVSLLALTDCPGTAIWLNEEEKSLAASRVKSERIGMTELLDGLAFFLPTIISTIYPAASVVQQQLYTVPPYALGTVACLVVCFLSTRLDRRGIFLVICAPFSIIGYSIFMGTNNGHARYGATFLPMCGVFAYGATVPSHISANVVSDTARSSAMGLFALMGNFGGLISTWTFLPSDRPSYHIGNGLNLAAQLAIFVIALGMFFWIRAENKKREGRDVVSELCGMSIQEIQDLDWKHPGFRFHN